MTEPWQPEPWYVEISRQLSVDLDSTTRYNGRTVAEVLAEKDEGRVFCTRQGNRRWEGREVRGRREGRWRFFEDDCLRFDVIYLDDRPGHIIAYRPDGRHDPDGRWEGRWAQERSGYEAERARLCRLISYVALVEDLPNAVLQLRQHGATDLQIIVAIRELLGCTLKAASQLVKQINMP